MSLIASGPTGQSQQSDEWFQAKLGKVGCSKLGLVMTGGRAGKPSETRKKYMLQLICEQLTGERSPGAWSNAIQWGIDNEPIARKLFAEKTRFTVTEDFGKECEAIPGLWCSPDGLLLDFNGGVEFKCPETATHVNTLLTGEINSDYLYQMAGQCLVYSLDFVDFVSFDPRMPDGLKMYAHRYYREDLPVQEITCGVRDFLIELEALKEKLLNVETLA